MVMMNVTPGAHGPHPEREKQRDLRWEDGVRQRALDMAYRHPARAAEIVLEMLERLESGAGHRQD